MDSTLVIIDDEDENQYVHDMANKKQSSIWIGLTEYVSRPTGKFYSGLTIQHSFCEYILKN